MEDAKREIVERFGLTPLQLGDTMSPLGTTLWEIARVLDSLEVVN